MAGPPSGATQGIFDSFLKARVAGHGSMYVFASRTQTLKNSRLLLLRGPLTPDQWARLNRTAGRGSLGLSVFAGGLDLYATHQANAQVGGTAQATADLRSVGHTSANIAGGGAGATALAPVGLSCGPAAVACVPAAAAIGYFGGAEAAGYVYDRTVDYIIEGFDDGSTQRGLDRVASWFPGVDG